MRPDIAKYARARTKDAVPTEAPASAAVLTGGSTSASAPVPGFTRRAFIEVSAGGAAFVLAFHLGGEAAAQGETVTTKERPSPNPFDAWVRITKDGTVTIILAKSEMGQGAMTALPMILADELDVDWAKVRVEQAPTNPALYEHGTGGSGSTKDSWKPLRQTGAAGRAMLVAAAAAQWKVDPAACQTAKGVVTGPAGQKLAYADLVEAAAKQPVPDFKLVALKKDPELTIVGTSPRRLDFPAKIDGSARFGIDVRVPGMLYAVIARCPTIGGKPLRFDAAKAKAAPGVTDVVEIAPTGAAGAFAPGGVAVVADSTWAAIQGRNALSIEWDRGPHQAESSAVLSQQMEQLLAQPGKVCRNDGDAEAALGRAEKKVEAVYELPFEAHATMEPMNATVHVKPGSAEAWLSTQSPDWTQKVIAQIAGLHPEQVTVHTTLLGGGFGRRYHADFAAEAAQVSKAVAAPVQVVWTRDDDIQHGFYRPMARHRLAAALDERGRPLAWRHRISSTSIDGFWDPGKAKPESSEIGGSVNLGYAIPNLRVEYAQAKSAVPVMWWRSVEHSITAFVNESFLDELAHLAGADPLRFRLDLLAEPRMVKFPVEDGPVLDTRRLRGVLELAAAKSGWGSPLPAGRGRGIACHFSFDSYAAEVAEVSVEKGKIRVHRVVAAVDVGRAVHPDSVTAQVEGAVAYGLSAALKGAVTIKDGACEQSNFHDFEVLRLPEMPVVQVHIVPSTEAPTGIGEPGLPPVAPAVMNAVFAATGKRLRRLPVRAQDFA
jgi:isoquinoline 1-oxidoreductase beta subunit